MSNSNNPPISDSGLRNPAVCRAWKHTAIVAAVSVVSWLLLALYFHYMTGAPYYIPLVLGAVVTVLVFFLGHLVSRSIKATCVNVFEDRVCGAAVGEDFTIARTLYLWAGNKKKLMKLTGFDIAVNQITSVNLTPDHAVVISAAGANYKCFVSNGSAIRDAISKKIQSM